MWMLIGHKDCSMETSSACNAVWFRYSLNFLQWRQKPTMSVLETSPDIDAATWSCPHSLKGFKKPLKAL